MTSTNRSPMAPAVRQREHEAKIDLRLPASVRDMVWESAQSHGCSMAQWVREAISGRLAIEAASSAEAWGGMEPSPSFAEWVREGQG